jgi:ATP-dependent DNA ligase
MGSSPAANTIGTFVVTVLAANAGEQWLHEVKFDGWRIQLHKHGRSAANSR